MTALPAILLGFVPVVLFLVGLIFMDSYKLVAPRAVALALAAGCVSALAALLVTRVAIGALHADPAPYTRVAAPLLEETLKALYVIHLVRAHKAGFMVDAGILGFAVGTGFALTENLYYVQALADFRPLLWVARGLGTAVMHGAATAMVAILYKDLADRHESRAVHLLVPGLALAIALHAGFNHLTLQPLVVTAILLLVMPLLLVLVFERSERATRTWLGSGIDGDVEVLEQLLGDQFTDSHSGRYLETLRARFSGPVVADMLCLLRIHLELSLGAKGILLARSAGIRIPVDSQVRENFAELRYLERSIGATGKLALLPILRNSSRELWQHHMLER